MRFNKSSNPAFGKDRFSGGVAVSAESAERMTVNGALNKTVMLFVLLLASGALAWKYFTPENFGMLVGVGAIGGLVLALVTIFKPHLSPYTAPAYALFEGLALGALSAMYEGFMDGIVLQAVGLTLSILLIMLALYRSKVLRATPKFKRGVIIATAGVFFFYVLNWIFSMFGGGVNIANMGLIGIGIQLVIIVIASLNLILDFDNFEKGEANGMPKYYEWYAGFGIMVTLIWLYIEILRLLAILSGRE